MQINNSNKIYFASLAYSQWWHPLVNAYEVKAGMVCLQCKNCVIHTWKLQR